MGMSVERREKRCGRETVPGRRVSTSTTREMEHDSTSDLDRRASRYPVRYDRVRHSRTGRIACAVRRDAPVFKNAALTRDDLGPFMRRYAKDHDIMIRPQCMLVDSFNGDKILIGIPLLRWYLECGLVASTR